MATKCKHSQLYFSSPGYTRSPPNSGNSNPCVLCSCNNRSRECDPDNGVCENCRIGTEGDWCERCEPNVDNSTDSDCSRCFPEYYGLTEQARGCTREFFAKP